MLHPVEFPRLCPFVPALPLVLFCRGLFSFWMFLSSGFAHGAVLNANLSATNDPYCTISPEALRYVSPSTLKMASNLERMAQESDPAENPYLSREIAAALEQFVPKVTNSLEAIQLRWRIAKNYLNAGETRKAISLFEEMEKLRGTNRFTEHVETQFQRYHAVAYLRLAEQENCLTNHNPESCILPIREGGVHKLTEGSRKAVEILEEQLRKTPHDSSAVWLLNIAHMTLGQYPDQVPPQWRIDPEYFASDYDIGRFHDIAGNLGLDIDDLAGGTITEDFDADGDLDIMMSDWGLRGPLHYFRNNGDGSFTDATMEAGLSGLINGLHIVQGDYNNDGLPDVLVLRGSWLLEAGRFPDSLLRNDGNGHFTDVTEEAGLLVMAPNQTAVWLDYNNDGWLDIFFGYETMGQHIYPAKLFRNNHDGTFTDVSAASGCAVIGFVKGVTSADFNNDGLPDLYLSLAGAANILLRNDGPRAAGGDWKAEWKFTDVSANAGVTEPIVSFPTWFFDYDNDGWEDIFVAGYRLEEVGDIAVDYAGGEHNAEQVRLYRNNHDGTFTDVTKATGLETVVHAMGCNFGDFDNDGWLDMYLGTGDSDLATLIPNRAFRNAAGEKFQGVTTSGGLGHLQKGHGVSFADLDRDGDQDIYHSVGGAYPGDFYRNALFENPGHGNHWISLKVRGVQSNAAGIGARIRVEFVENGNSRVMHRTVTTGSSFGANPLEQHIGLGRATHIKALEISWPVTGKKQRFTNLQPNRHFELREGEPIKEAKRPRVKFKKTAPAPHTHSVHSAVNK